MHVDSSSEKRVPTAEGEFRGPPSQDISVFRQHNRHKPPPAPRRAPVTPPPSRVPARGLPRDRRSRTRPRCDAWLESTGTLARRTALPVESSRAAFPETETRQTPFRV